jgi:hypothetical protein
MPSRRFKCWYGTSKLSGRFRLEEVVDDKVWKWVCG